MRRTVKPRWEEYEAQRISKSSLVFFYLPIAGDWAHLPLLSCGKSQEQPKSTPSRPSDIIVQVQNGGSVVLTTSAAEFQILPSGFLGAKLLKDRKRLTLDEPGVGTSAVNGYLIHDGKELLFTPDFSQAKVSEASGKLGRGKRVEIPAHPLLPADTAIERTVVLEVYDDFPTVGFVSVTYKKRRHLRISHRSGNRAAAPFQRSPGRCQSPAI